MMFKVGNRVELKRDSRNSDFHVLKKGNIGTITKIESGFQITLNGNDKNKTMINVEGIQPIKSWKDRFK